MRENRNRMPLLTVKSPTFCAVTGSVKWKDWVPSYAPPRVSLSGRRCLNDSGKPQPVSQGISGLDLQECPSILQILALVPPESFIFSKLMIRLNF